MEEQTKTRGSSQNNTGSDHQNVWSEENEIYYYSNFELFENTSVTQLFYQYSIFIEEVSKQLGQQWKLEAQLLVQTHMNSRQIFMNVLAIWLKHHGPKFISNTPAPTFDQSVVEEFQIQIRSDLGNKVPQNYKINRTSARAICMGFFLTANQIWDEMFQNNKKEDPAKNYLLGSVSKTFERSFKPIMVVRQKISSLFGRKKVHRNESVSSNIDTANSENIFENCFLQFRRNLDLQKEVERKMSEVNLEDQGFEKNEIISQKKYMSTQSFQQQQAPVKQTLISSVYKYVTEFLNKNYSWNVASSFVTQILELSQIDAEQGTTIKVLRPAEDFYNKLVLVWLSFKKNDMQIDFGQYLARVKSSFGLSWQEKYIIPTKYFFDKLNENWGQIQLEVSQKKITDREIMDLLLSRIRARMEIDWNRKIRIKEKRVKTQEKMRQ